MKISIIFNRNSWTSNCKNHRMFNVMSCSEPGIRKKLVTWVNKEPWSQGATNSDKSTELGQSSALVGSFTSWNMMMGVWTPDKTGVLWSYPYYPATITGENPTNVMLQWWRGCHFFSWSIGYRQTEIYSPGCQHAVAPPLGASIPPIPTFERRRKGAHVSLSVSIGNFHR